VPLPLIYLTARPAGITYLLQLAAFIVVALVLSLPMIRFRIVPKRRMWARAHAEAMHQFLAQGIHLTEHRTGVLIFASVAERYAEIVADSGINAKVQGHCSHDFRNQGRASRRRLRGCRRVVRRAAGRALPTRRAKPRRATEQGGRDMKQTLQLGFCFSAAPRCWRQVRLASRRRNQIARSSLLGQDVIRVMRISLAVRLQLA
jgi:hypothetical protein